MVIDSVLELVLGPFWTTVRKHQAEDFVLFHFQVKANVDHLEAKQSALEKKLAWTQAEVKSATYNAVACKKLEQLRYKLLEQVWSLTQSLCCFCKKNKKYKHNSPIYNECQTQ